MSYKRLVLFQLLTDLYPGISITCLTSYNSIILHNTTQPLVPEQTIIDLYPAYVQKYNLSILRRERQVILSASDMYGLADYPFPDAATKQAWMTYRQALRTITDTYPNPETDADDKLIGIVWPVPPGGSAPQRQ
jgi:hypothetical protein